MGRVLREPNGHGNRHRRGRLAVESHSATETASGVAVWLLRGVSATETAFGVAVWVPERDYFTSINSFQEVEYRGEQWSRRMPSA